MTVLLIRRLAILAAALVVASAVIFVVLEVLPGDAARTLLGPDAPPDTVAALAAKLGLDRPPLARYLGWIGGLFGGDLGTSYVYGTPAGALIAERLAVSVPLAALAMGLTVVLALVLGLLAASRHRTLADAGIMVASQIGIAVPSFWLSILLILAFAAHLNWFPAGGFPGWSAGAGPALRALALPAIALAAVQAAVLARVTRSALLDVMGEDFVRTARAKGLTRRQALWRHALRNAMVPVVTVMGLQVANLLAGTVVVENVFRLPGLGRLIFQSIQNRDAVVVRDAVMLLAATVLVVNFATDLVSVAIDPRLKTRAAMPG